MKIKILALAALAAVCIVCVHLGAPYAADIAVLLLMCLAVALIIKAHQREAALVERCETDSLTGLKTKPAATGSSRRSTRSLKASA